MQRNYLSSRAATSLYSAVPKETSSMLHLSARYFPREKQGVRMAATSFRFRISLSALTRGEHGETLPAEGGAEGCVSVQSTCVLSYLTQV